MFLGPAPKKDDMDNSAFLKAAAMMRDTVEAALQDNPAEDDSVTLQPYQMDLLMKAGRAFVAAEGQARGDVFNRIGREFWVREEWHEVHWNREIDDIPDQVVYAAGGCMLLPARVLDDESFPARDDEGNEVPWKKPGDMPRWASRYRVALVDVSPNNGVTMLEVRLTGEPMKTIMLNGVPTSVNPVISYEDAVKLAGFAPDAAVRVSYRGLRIGVLIAGQTIKVDEGMVVNVVTA